MRRRFARFKSAIREDFGTDALHAEGNVAATKTLALVSGFVCMALVGQAIYAKQKPIEAECCEHDGHSLQPEKEHR